MDGIPAQVVEVLGRTGMRGEASRKLKRKIPSGMSVNIFLIMLIL